MKVRGPLPGELENVVDLWLASFWSSRYARDSYRFPGGKRKYLDAHGPRLLRICERSTVSVLCDEEREGAILALCVADGDVIHYVMAKRSLHGHRVSADAFRALLGKRLDRPCVYTHELCEFHDYRKELDGLTIPNTWRYDPYALLDEAA